MRSAAIQSTASVTREETLSRATLLRLVALTPAVLLIHGYHPFADDAAIYVAGVRKLVNPALFQIDAPFVTANAHLSVFTHVLAWVVRLSHMPLSIVLLATYLVSIYAFLLGSWLVATRLFDRGPERWFAVCLAAACFTLPAAGTALVLMDPYVTARSFSTPLGLFAMAAVLDRRWALAALFVVLAGIMHPLMGLYAAVLVILYALVDSGRPRGAAALGAVGIAVAGGMQLALRHVPVPHAYYEAVYSITRAYFFPLMWRWYEDAGLVVPLVLLLAAMRRSCGRIQALCRACVVLGTSSIIAAFLFVRPSGPFFLVRLQLLRSFHIIYLMGVLLLGGWLAKTIAGRKGAVWMAALLLVAASAGLFAAQRATYPLSAHIEWPGAYPRNPWAQAYWWIRENTPQNALFAADPYLIFRDGVDQQGFRVTTERSLLADDKDQGVVMAMEPSIARLWAAQRDAQEGINTITDAERVQRLRPFGVTWLLLPSDAATAFPCPYRNAAAKVCRMD